MRLEKPGRCEALRPSAILEVLPRASDIQRAADRNYALLKADPFHPILHFKKIGAKEQLWSVHTGLRHRALGIDTEEGVVWFWIGTHANYDRILS